MKKGFAGFLCDNSKLFNAGGKPTTAIAMATTLRPIGIMSFLVSAFRNYEACNIYCLRNVPPFDDESSHEVFIVYILTKM